MNDKIKQIEDWIDNHGCDKAHDKNNAPGHGEISGGNEWPKSGHLSRDGRSTYGAIMRTHVQYEGYSRETFYG